MPIFTAKHIIIVSQALFHLHCNKYTQEKPHETIIITKSTSTTTVAVLRAYNNEAKDSQNAIIKINHTHTVRQTLSIEQTFYCQQVCSYLLNAKSPIGSCKSFQENRYFRIDLLRFSCIVKLCALLFCFLSKNKKKKKSKHRSSHCQMNNKKMGSSQKYAG